MIFTKYLLNSSTKLPKTHLSLFKLSFTSYSTFNLTPRLTHPLKKKTIITPSVKLFSTQSQSSSLPFEEQEPLNMPNQPSDQAQQVLKQFKGLKYKRLPQRILKLEFERDVLKAEQDLINEFGFLKQEVDFIVRYKPSVLLLNHAELLGKDEGSIRTLHEIFVKRMGYSDEFLRTLVVKYPYVVGKSEEHIIDYYRIMKENGVNQELATKQLIECPKLISIQLEYKIKEICFLFHLYHKVSREEVFQIFEKFPYLFCCDIDKVQKFLGKFKQYRMNKNQVIKLCSESAGLLAIKVQTFTGLFDYMRKRWGFKATEIVKIIDEYPEFAFQNRRNLFKKKIDIILKETRKNDTYMRNVIKRHPELFLKSWASYEAKITYFHKKLNRTLIDEKTFPLVLLFNYNAVIRPRCEILREKFKFFEFQDVFPLTDEQFCLAYDISPEELQEKIAEKAVHEEKDKLWNYVSAL